MTTEQNKPTKADLLRGAKIAGHIARAVGDETDEMKKFLQDPDTPQEIKDAYVDGVIAADLGSSEDETEEAEE